MDAQRTLEDEISAVFARCCREHDWEIAEFLFQAIEAIVRRGGDESRLDAACGELLEQFTARKQ